MKRMADTYYIYDALGNLRFVLPPGLKGMEEESGNSWDIRSNEALRNMAYFYRYDRRLNCVEKKMPGTEPVTYLYDKTRNAVFSQDGNQRHLSLWHFAVPDRFGRPVFEGLCSTPDSALLADTWIHAVRSGHNSTGNGLSMNGYEVNFPMSVEKILTVKYYDNYDFLTMEGFSALPSYRSRGSAKGLLTGMATAVLPSDTCIFSAQWYDDEDRVNAYFTTNLIGGYDVTTTKYSFTGKPVSVKNLHRTRLVDLKYAYETLTNTYDSADRLVKSIKYIPRVGNITLAENTYDGLGRLATSGRNGNEAFTTTYRYNINGWLTDIHSPVFTESLFYEKSHNNSQAQYGGNISAVDWKVGGVSDNGRTRGYSFRYDKMSRLIKADYFENGLASDHYSTAYSYDLMGNITSIKRNGLLDDDEFGLIDDLTLSYQGNQMVKVYDDAEGPVYKNAMHFADGTDKDVEYSYDANGNMTMDLNKNIESITYNSLGLPEHVKTGRVLRIGSVRNENNINYTYAADGRKLRVKYITTHPTVNREGKCLIPSFPVIKPSYYTFEYCGNWIFRDSTLHDILFDGGYISFERNTPHVHFYFRDHLGNVRVVTDRDGNIEQSNHYYPFGATFGESTNPNLQWFKYNGKELDTMYGLNLYDYSARAHDPLLGRFTTQDPQQEKCYGMNPYGYCVNNPFRFVDYNGLYPIGFIKQYKRNVKRSILVGTSYIVLYPVKEIYYKFTESAAYILSLVSGVSYNYIKNVNLFEFRIQEPGNCITIGDSPDNVCILVSPYYLNDEYGGQDYNLWLREFSHEVGHIKQIARDKNAIVYALKSLLGYVKTLNHDNAPREKEADQGSNTFDDFNKFVKKTYKTSVENLMKRCQTEDSKINIIKKWWENYINQNK